MRSLILGTFLLGTITLSAENVCFQQSPELKKTENFLGSCGNKNCRCKNCRCGVKCSC